MASIPTITAPTWPPEPGRLAEAAKVGAFALGVLLLEALLAHGVSGPQVARYVFLFIGVFVLALVFRFPLATALVFLGFTDFIFHSDYFSHPVGSLEVRPHEVALACLLLVAFVKPKRRTWGGPVGAALAVFLAMIAISAVLGVEEHGTSLTDAFNTARAFGMLTFFYVVVRLFPSAAERRLLLTGAAAIAAVAGLVALLVALGAGFGASLQDPGGQTIRDEGIGSIERVRLVGLSAAYGLFWYVVAQLSAKQGLQRLGWSLALGGFGLAIAVSFNRNMWLGLAIGAMLMAVFGGTLVRNRMAVGVAVAVAGVAILVVFGSSSTSGKVVQPLLKRGETILNPAKTEKEDSLQARAHENAIAWSVAKDNLVFGVGSGSEFGVFKPEPISTGSFVIGTTMTPQTFLHNQYLYLILVAGVPGLIAFLLFLGLPLAHALRRLPSDPAITGLGVGLAMIMLSSVVAIYFSVEDMTAVLGLLAGVLVADMEGPYRRREPSGLIS